MASPVRAVSFPVRAGRGAAEGYLLGSARAGMSRLYPVVAPRPAGTPLTVPAPAVRARFRKHRSHGVGWGHGGVSPQDERATQAASPRRSRTRRAEETLRRGTAPHHTIPPRGNPQPRRESSRTRRAEETLRRGTAPHHTIPPRGNRQPRREPSGTRRAEETLRRGTAPPVRSRSAETRYPGGSRAARAGSRRRSGGAPPHAYGPAPRKPGYRRANTPDRGEGTARPPNGSGSGRRAGLYAGFCRPVTSRSPGRRPSI